MSVEMRNILCETLAEAMRKNNKIVSIDSDLGKADGTMPLRKEFPDRAFDVGIAEANMTGIAAGMAAYGMIPVINTFTAFASRRACDQIAISACYANQNVKIIGTDPGVTAELNGGTHMSFEDVGVLRSIPNILIAEPSDGIELRKMMEAVLEYQGPVYIRMYRKALDDINTEDYEFKLGKANVMREGKDVTIIASGILVAEALKAGDKLAENGIDAEIINIHTIKPLDEQAVLKSAKKTGVIVTCENHNIMGGLRSAVAETISLNYPVKIYPVGVDNIKGEVGKLDYLKERFGLTAETIFEKAVLAVKQK
ncbi:MAG TPA: transketolase C-terminal domain-containing protein [Syntrophomonas sp.]|nr:transketolase C-terminal domain-containing protein [Syntrophomonas sp.]